MLACIYLTTESNAFLLLYCYQRGDGALHIVVRRGDLNTLKLLRDHGADVNLSNSLGDTPAILAARHGDKESLCILIDAGADLSLANKVRFFQSVESRFDVELVAAFANFFKIMPVCLK